MRNYKLKIAGLLLFSLVFLAPSFGQPNRYGRMDFRQGRNFYGQQRGAALQYRGMARQDRWGSQAGRIGWFGMDLTEEQQEQLQTLRTEFSDNIEPLNDKLSELRASERTLLSEDEVDLDAVNKIIDERTDLTAQISKLRVEYNVNTRAVLTEEQLDRMGQRRNLNSRRRF